MKICLQKTCNKQRGKWHILSIIGLDNFGIAQRGIQKGPDSKGMIWKRTTWFLVAFCSTSTSKVLGSLRRVECLDLKEMPDLFIIKPIEICLSQKVSGSAPELFDKIKRKGIFCRFLVVIIQGGPLSAAPATLDFFLHLEHTKFIPT